MAHRHEHASDLDASSRALGVSLALTATFMTVEALVGVYAHSLALLADAGHMMSDTGALALALVAQRWALRRPDARATYGYRRTEVLAAFVSGISLVLIALYILSEAVERWAAPHDIRAGAMLVTALTGLLVNAAVAAILTRPGKRNVNVRAALTHVMVDAFGSVAAIAAALAVLVLEIRRADPALSVLIAGLVVYSAWRILAETTTILLESAPRELDIEEFGLTVAKTPGVDSFHDLHVWRISDGFDVATVHVVVEPGYHPTETCREVRARVGGEHALRHLTVQPESPRSAEPSCESSSFCKRI